MTNYAWANPITGIREQADTLEEARLRIWDALQAPDTVTDQVTIWRQSAAFKITLQSVQNYGQLAAEPWTSYAWASPVHATRHWHKIRGMAIDGIRRELQNSPEADAVILYMQREAGSVDRFSPRPILETLETACRITGLENEDSPRTRHAALDELITKVEEGSDVEFFRASTLAQLYAAQALVHIWEIMDALDAVRPQLSGTDTGSFPDVDKPQ